MFGVLVDELRAAGAGCPDFPSADVSEEVRVAVAEGVGECPSLASWATSVEGKQVWSVRIGRRGEVAVNSGELSHVLSHVYVDMGHVVSDLDIAPVLVSAKLFVGMNWGGDYVMFYVV